MQAYTPMPASEEAMTAFHEPDYISFLRHVTPDNQARQPLAAPFKNGVLTQSTPVCGTSLV